MDYKRAADVLDFSAEWNGSGRTTRSELIEAKRIAGEVLRRRAIEWRSPEDPIDLFVPILICREKEKGKPAEKAPGGKRTAGSHRRSRKEAAPYAVEA